MNALQLLRTVLAAAEPGLPADHATQELKELLRHQPGNTLTFHAGTYAVQLNCRPGNETIRVQVQGPGDVDVRFTFVNIDDTTALIYGRLRGDQPLVFKPETPGVHALIRGIAGTALKHVRSELRKAQRAHGATEPRSGVESAVNQLRQQLHTRTNHTPQYTLLVNAGEYRVLFQSLPGTHPVRVHVIAANSPQPLTRFTLDSLGVHCVLHDFTSGFESMKVRPDNSGVPALLRAATKLAVERALAHIKKTNSAQAAAEPPAKQSAPAQLQAKLWKAPGHARKLVQGDHVVTISCPANEPAFEVLVRSHKWPEGFSTRFGLFGAAGQMHLYSRGSSITRLSGNLLTNGTLTTFLHDTVFWAIAYADAAYKAHIKKAGR